MQLLRITLKLPIVINGSTRQAWVVRHGHLTILQVIVQEMGLAHIIMWLRLDFLCTTQCRFWILWQCSRSISSITRVQTLVYTWTPCTKYMENYYDSTHCCNILDTKDKSLMQILHKTSLIWDFSIVGIVNF